MGFSPTKDKVNCPERAREGGLGHDDAVSVDFGRFPGVLPFVRRGSTKSALRTNGSKNSLPVDLGRW